jgi:hypothetical protein
LFKPTKKLAVISIFRDERIVRFKWQKARAERLVVTDKLGDAANRYVFSVMDPQVAIHDASSALSRAIDLLAGGLGDTANIAAEDPDAQRLDHESGLMAARLFDDMINRGDVRLIANSIYRTEFEKDQFDFGAEWKLRVNAAHLKDFADRWVLHGHLSVDAPQTSAKGFGQYDFSRARITPKVLHIKPIAHVMDKEWSEDVATPSDDRLDLREMLMLIRKKAFLFKTFDSGVSRLSGKTFPTILLALETGRNYRLALTEALRSVVSRQVV